MLIRNIEFFVEVSKCKSISEAAKKLYISQQTLSSAIQNLERDLGIALFERSSTGISITEKGKEFLSDAIKILNILDYWENHNSEPKNNISGNVDIAGGEPFGKLMVQLVTELRTSHPSINVNFHVVPSHDLPDYLWAKKARIGLAACSATYSIRDLQQFAQEKNLEMEQVGLTRLVMIVNRNNDLCREKVVSLSDCKHMCLALRNNERSLNFVDIHKHFKKTYSFYNIKQVATFVGANKDAAAFVPAIIFREDIMPHHPDVTSIELSDYGIVHPLFLFYPKEEECRPEERVVIDIVRRLERVRSM